jgi:hypothetical protein
MLLAGVALLAAGLVVVVVVVATYGGDHASTNLPASRSESSPVSAVDAMPATTTSVPEDREPRDAVVVDAPSPSVAETPADASIAPPHTAAPPSTGKHHVRTTKPAPSSTTPDVDRGD